MPPPPGGSLIVRNSTIAGNEAPNGGGIFYEPNSPDANLEIVNSTIADNTAGSRGGGLVLCCAGTIITNTTIVGNEAGQDVGGILAGGSTTLSSTIVSGNTREESVTTKATIASDLGDGPFDAGHSLIGTTAARR